jgi:urease accessory protein UreE
MRLVADGATPTSRLVLVKDLETDDGYAFELASPLFLAASDRIAVEDGRIVVVRASGERLSPAGDWSTRCGPGSLRRR